MTLDDAIDHAEEKSAEHGDAPCGAEHEQLAKWLRELRAFKVEADKQALWRKLNATAADLPQTIREWQQAVDDYAVSKGWREGEPDFAALMLMMTCEVAEAFEEYRDGHEITETYYKPEKPTKPEGVPSELADIVIRVLDFCGHVGIDLQAIMAEKHAFNQTRPFRHGGKRA